MTAWGGMTILHACHVGPCNTAGVDNPRVTRATALLARRQRVRVKRVAAAGATLLEFNLGPLWGPDADAAVPVPAVRAISFPGSSRKSASDFVAALPIKRLSTYREGGTACVPFQDKDHGMTMERRTMIFCCAGSACRQNTPRASCQRPRPFSQPCRIVSIPASSRRLRSDCGRPSVVSSGFLASFTFS